MAQTDQNVTCSLARISSPNDGTMTVDVVPPKPNPLLWALCDTAYGPA